MATRYYLMNSESFSNIENDIDNGVVWNISSSQCVIEVDISYQPPSYSQKFRTNLECIDYIYNPIRIDEWFQPDISEIP